MRIFEQPSPAYRGRGGPKPGEQHGYGYSRGYYGYSAYGLPPNKEAMKQPPPNAYMGNIFGSGKAAQLGQYGLHHPSYLNVYGGSIGIAKLEPIYDEIIKVTWEDSK